MNKDLLALQKSIEDFSVLDKIPEHIVVPAEWYPFVKLSTEDSIRYVASLWSKYYGEELRVLLEAFRKYLASVQLIEHDRRIALLYTFRNPRGEYLHYLGYAPLLPDQVPAAIDRLQGLDTFLNFYTHIHNGWYEAESHALGLLPLEECFLLAEKEWGVLDEITVDFSLEKVLAVFSNGAGGYLCWNLNTPEPSGLVWWDDEEPDFADFWDILDEWSAMGIEDY